MKMCLKAVILALSLLTLSAHPIHRNRREATWTDPRANQANDKADLTKDLEITYKSHIDSSSLYSHDDQSKNPVAEEMQQKLNMESERLRARLRQELAELHERLSPYPAHLGAALANMRERLAPFTKQLQSSLSSSTQDLCGQLSLYLQGLDTAQVAQSSEASRWVSQTLEHSSSKMADIISDFQAKAAGALEDLREEKSDLWQELSSRLGQEVSLLRGETQSRVSALETELTASLEATNARRSEVAASFELFCQNSALQSQVFQARMERLFEGLEEKLGVHGVSSLSSSSSSSLQEDFSVKFSALMEDILHSVQ